MFIKDFKLFIEGKIYGNFDKGEVFPDITNKLVELFDTKIKKSNIVNIRSDFEVILSNYEESLVDLIDSGNIQEIDIKFIIKDIKKKLNPVIDKELNITEFLRMVNNVIRVPKRKTTLKLEKLFESYYDTLPKRFERLLDVFTGKRLSEYEDKFEDDKSVLDRVEYENELYDLQIQLNRLQKWVTKNKKRVALIFEGRDAAGKGSTIKQFVQYMPLKGYRVVTMDIPTPEEMDGDNWFKRYEKHMPKEGEIVFFDRSWYGMALVNPTMGYCTEEQYRYFMKNVNDFEDKLTEEGIDLIKLWFSITQEKQLQRFKIRQDSELKYWKYSESDMKSVDKWDIFTKYKEQCFAKTSTWARPWVIVNSNDKKLAQLNAIRYVLDYFNYDGKNKEITTPYPDIVYELK